MYSGGERKKMSLVGSTIIVELSFHALNNTEYFLSPLTFSCQMSNLHNCKVIYVCCFKPLLVVICYNSHRKRIVTNSDMGSQRVGLSNFQFQDSLCQLVTISIQLSPGHWSSLLIRVLEYPGVALYPKLLLRLFSQFSSLIVTFS